METEIRLNGRQVQLDLNPPDRTLLDWLREDRGLTGTKEGCNEGDCGACTVMVSDRFNGKLRRRAVNSCIMFLPQLIGKEVHTVEGLTESDGTLHPVQKEMIKHHGSQCGFCTPGFVMSMAVAHANGNREHDDVLSGNLCRCTGYAPIIRAAEAAVKQPIPDWLTTTTISKLRWNELASNELLVPKDVDHLARWYADNPKAILVAGATDVGLWVTKHLRELRPLCFVGDVEGLADIKLSTEWFEVGAAVSLGRLKDALTKLHPSFAELLRRFGSVQVRNSATIGGNIANGSPIGDAAPALIALDAELTLRHRNSRRTIPLENFFVDYGKQDRREGEFVESLRFPVQPDRLRCYKISKRFDQDISAVCGCINISLENDCVKSARMAFGGMAATPKRATLAEKALEGKPWVQEFVSEAMNAMNGDFLPITDARASKEYRLKTARNILQKYFVQDTNPEEVDSVLHV